MTFGNYYFAGGPASLLVLVLTAFALVAAVVAVAVSIFVRNAVVPALGCSVLVAGALVIAALGIGSAVLARQRVDEALLGADPSMRAELQAEGDAEARQPMVMGVLGAALPGLAGAALGLLALKRRSERA